jgi:hypothetical protein
VNVKCVLSDVPEFFTVKLAWCPVVFTYRSGVDDPSGVV